MYDSLAAAIKAISISEGKACGPQDGCEKAACLAAASYAVRISERIAHRPQQGAFLVAASQAVWISEHVAHWPQGPLHPC